VILPGFPRKDAFVVMTDKGYTGQEDEAKGDDFRKRIPSRLSSSLLSGARKGERCMRERKKETEATKKEKEERHIR
jgi:hypothetical protein